MVKVIISVGVIAAADIEMLAGKASEGIAGAEGAVSIGLATAPNRGEFGNGCPGFKGIIRLTISSRFKSPGFMMISL